MNIVMSDQDYVDAYEQGVDKILQVLDISGALVTDESQVYDFLFPIVDVTEQQDHIIMNNDMLDQLSDLVGRPVKESDLIWRLARDVQERMSRVYH